MYRFRSFSSGSPLPIWWYLSRDLCEVKEWMGRVCSGRRLSLIKDSVAVIMTYPQRAGMQVRLEMGLQRTETWRRWWRHGWTDERQNFERGETVEMVVLPMCLLLLFSLCLPLPPHSSNFMLFWFPWSWLFCSFNLFLVNIYLLQGIYLFWKWAVCLSSDTWPLMLYIVYVYQHQIR